MLSSPTTLSVAAESGQYGGALPISFTLTSNGSPVSGEPINIYINGVNLGTGYTDSNGDVSGTVVDGGYLGYINVGTYTGGITATFNGDSNFGPSSGSNDLTITPAPLIVAADNQAKVYGQNNPAITAAVNGVFNGDDVSANFTTTAGLYSDVGGYPVTFTGLTGAKAIDYSTTVTGGSASGGTLTITPTPLTVTVDDQSKVYGQANPTLTGTVVGVLNGDDVTALYTTTATQSSAVAPGGYPITLAGLTGAKAQDYSTTIAGGSVTPGTLTVTPAPLTITADDQSKVYGAALPSLTASYTGLVNGDTSASLDTLPTVTTTATAASHVAGSPYAITASGAVDGDYKMTYVAGNLTVTPAPLTITADDQSKVYGAALPSLTASYTGLVNGDTSASLDTLPTVTTTATAASHVAGSPYAITASGAVDGDYKMTYVAGNLTVTPAPLTITADDQSKVYGAALPSLTASYTGLVNGDTSASLDTLPTVTTTATAASHVAGSPYAITASGAVDGDYKMTYVAGNLTVTPAPLTITADDQSKVYGAALPSLTASYTGLVNGDTSASLDTLPTVTTTATAASHVAGSPYAITASGAVDGDYKMTYVAGNLTVTPAPLTITADDQSKVYGAALPSLTASYTGLVNGDTSASLDAAPTLSATATATSDVSGSPYIINASGCVDADYAIGYADGSLSVTPAPLRIVANNPSKVYGQVNPVLTGTVSGILNGDDVSAGYATAATQYSDVRAGGYPITFTGLSAAKAGDYSTTVAGGSFTPGSLTVTPAPLSVVAGNASKLYGAAVPALSGTVGGVLNGDDVSVGYATTANASNHVMAGGFPITASGLSGAKAGDYALSTTVAGTLTLTPAPLTIAATNATKVYGQPNPNFLATYAGFVLGQGPGALTGSLSFSTPANVHSHVGQYPVLPGGTTSADYAIHFTSGTLAVTPALLVVTPASVVKTYGAAVPKLTAAYSGFVNGDSPSRLTTPVNLTTTATIQSAVGIYPIVARGASSPDYTVRYGVGSVTVPAPGSSNRVAFLNVLYEDILGRAPEPSGMAFWLQRMASGVNPASVFRQIYLSPEARALRASHRAPTIGMARIYSLALQALNQRP